MRAGQPACASSMCTITGPCSTETSRFASAAEGCEGAGTGRGWGVQWCMQWCIWCMQWCMQWCVQWCVHGMGMACARACACACACGVCMWRVYVHVTCTCTCTCAGACARGMCTWMPSRGRLGCTLLVARLDELTLVAEGRALTLQPGRNNSRVTVFSCGGLEVVHLGGGGAVGRGRPCQIGASSRT